MYASAMQRGYGWHVLVGIMGMIFVLGFGQVAAQGEVGHPGSSLLCISECGTCPVICSSPPAPLVTIYPPTPPLLAPFPVPPPPPLLTPIPPSPVRHSPPRSPPPPPPPPSSYSYGGTPPPPKYSSSPPYHQAPPTVGPQQYPYPYYYYYASEASSVSFSCFILACIVALLHYFAIQC